MRRPGVAPSPAGQRRLRVGERQREAGAGRRARSSSAPWRSSVAAARACPFDERRQRQAAAAARAARQHAQQEHAGGQPDQQHAARRAVSVRAEDQSSAEARGRAPRRPPPRADRAARSARPRPWLRSRAPSGAARACFGDPRVSRRHAVGGPSRRRQRVVEAPPSRSCEPPVARRCQAAQRRRAARRLPAFRPAPTSSRRPSPRPTPRPGAWRSQPRLSASSPLREWRRRRRAAPPGDRRGSWRRRARRPARAPPPLATSRRSVSGARIAASSRRTAAEHGAGGEAADAPPASDGLRLCRTQRTSATASVSAGNAEEDQRDDAEHARAELARGNVVEGRHVRLRGCDRAPPGTSELMRIGDGRQLVGLLAARRATHPARRGSRCGR